MGRSKKYMELYPILKQEYLDGKSLTKIGKEYKVDRGRLSKNLKSDGVIVDNKQNLVRVKDEFIFSSIDSEEKAYWLGFLYADGYVSYSGNRIELALQKRDLEHIKKFKQFIGCSNNIVFNKKTNSYKISFRSQQIKQDLINLGCVPRKSLILKFPSQEQVPKDLCKHFVRGYIDGDGYIGRKQDGISYRLSILGTKEFLEVLVETMQYKKLSIRKIGNIYCVEWSARYVEEYLVNLYFGAHIFLERKKEILMPSLIER